MQLTFQKVQLRRLPPRIAVTMAIALTCASPSLAGDTAELHILGFSNDGRIFAFEEYGVQDGSGFPYANRFYIDTMTDSYMSGSPIRVRLDDETKDVAAARREARERGEKIIAQSELDANPGFTAACNPVTEVSADPERLEAYPRPYFPPIDPALEFRLDAFPVTEGKDRCYDLAQLKGFTLTLVEAGESKVLHKDVTVPKSRGCATDYRLGGLQTFGPDGFSTYAVIISVQQLGFEGPDYRWMAVTGRR